MGRLDPPIIIGCQFQFDIHYHRPYNTANGQYHRSVRLLIGIIKPAHNLADKSECGSSELSQFPLMPVCNMLGYFLTNPNGVFPFMPICLATDSGITPTMCQFSSGLHSIVIYFFLNLR